MSVARRFAFCLAALVFGAFAAGAALAQAAFPGRPIRIIVGFAPGGSTDVLARMAAQECQRLFGWEMVVINKPGATSTIAMGEVAAATPDGYTIGLVPSGVMTITHLFQNSRPDLLERTEALMVAGAQRTGIAVKADSPFRTLKDLIDAARKTPGKISIGTPGAGTGTTLLLRAVLMQAKVDVNLPPFQGDTPVAQAVLGGHVDAGGMSAAGFSEQVRAGSMRVLASLERDRLDVAPDSGTLIEQGYNLASGTLQYFLAPRGLPPEIKQKLIDNLGAATRQPAYIEMARKNTLYDPNPTTGAALDAYFLKERDTFTALVKQLGVGRADKAP